MKQVYEEANAKMLLAMKKKVLQNFGIEISDILTLDSKKDEKIAGDYKIV